MFDNDSDVILCSKCNVGFQGISVKQKDFILNVSVSSKHQHPLPPAVTPRILHLRSAQVSGFLQSELPRGWTYHLVSQVPSCQLLPCWVTFSSLNLVCKIPRSFERSSPSNFRTQGSFIHINSGKMFERDLLSSDSVEKSATQKP